MEGAGWVGEDGNWEVREELAKEEAERAGTTPSPQATALYPHTPVSLLQLSLLMFWALSELDGMFRTPN